MPASGQTIGHQLVDISVPNPNRGLAAILMSPNMELLMGIIGQEIVLGYQAKVAKRTGRLAGSASASTEVGGQKNDRWVSLVTVGGETAASIWHSPRNPNPGDLFYYGVLHELGDGGNPPSGWDFPAHKDLKVVLDAMRASNGF